MEKLEGTFQLLGFRMVLLSGEVETGKRTTLSLSFSPMGSGWFCYPGKLKRFYCQYGFRICTRFRMVLLSGEVETQGLSQQETRLAKGFRMVLLSGEVETVITGLLFGIANAGSGWFCYPGKLKPLDWIGWRTVTITGSGWFCYPGKLKQAGAVEAGPVEAGGSGWFCYPGKLKQWPLHQASGL